jgi:hypothetical protein
MYDEKKAQEWKFLYEHLRSFTRIVEYLKYQGIINIPYRNTIRDHIKLYCEYKNQNYENWLKKHPFLSIGLVDSGIFSKFPFEIRNRLCEIIIKIIIDCNGKMQNSKIQDKMLKKFKISKDIIMIWLYENPKFSEPFQKHISQLIFLLRYLYHITSTGGNPNMTALSCNKRINLNRRSIKRIIDNLKQKKLLFINYIL